MAKFIITDVNKYSNTQYNYTFIVSNGSTLTNMDVGLLTVSAFATEQDLRSAIVDSLVTYANKPIDEDGLGYTGVIASDVLYSMSPKLANVATSGSYSDLSNIPTKSFSNTARSLNTAFQISSTRDCFVSYGVDIAATLSLTGGATGTVTLQYADNSGMSTNLVTVNTSVNGNTGALTIGLSLTQTATATVSGIIPTGKYVRIVTTNTTGTPTFTYRSGQEVLA